MAQKIDCLVENPNLRIEMGAHGKEISKKYGMEQYMINFYKLMQKIKK